MSFKLIENVNKMYNQRTSRDHLPNGSFFWGKACTTGEEEITTMQHPVTCKDYVVDTYFKEPYSFVVNSWTEEQRYECCFWLQTPTPEHSKRLQQNITNFLNPYEAAHKLQRTELIDVSGNNCFNNLRQIYVIRGSRMWMKNPTAMSLYLSLIRLCAHKAVMKDLPFHKETGDLPCNEFAYYSQLDKPQQDVLHKYAANPRLLMGKFPEGINKYGYNAEKGDPGHGQTGMFHFLQTLKYAKNCPHINYTLSINPSHFAKLLYEEIYGTPYAFDPKNARKDQW